MNPYSEILTENAEGGVTVPPTLGRKPLLGFSPPNAEQASPPEKLIKNFSNKELRQLTDSNRLSVN